MRQDQALRVLLSGKSAFLTGEPGAGKTYLLRKFLQQTSRQVAITASTGIAATQIGGQTIHSWSGIGTREQLCFTDAAAIVRGWPGKRIRSAGTLIIDEVSMVSGDLLQMVDYVCRAARENNRPFGGLQVILVGDFFQLPPVKFDKWRFAFQAPAWEELNPRICYLTEQHRQADANFLGLLSAIRGGRGDPLSPLLRSRRLRGEAPRNITVLYTHRHGVDGVNATELAQLSGTSRTFHMTSEGPRHLTDALTRGCQSPETLVLKNGAVVMFTQNDPDGRFVNGTIGVVVDADRSAPLVRLNSGALVEAEPAIWGIPAARSNEEALDPTSKAGFYDVDATDDDEAPALLACIRQIPLRLGWAITVHKAQGMSLDAAVMDLSQSFAYGQGYVALSRVRSLTGLYLLGLNRRALKVHPEILEQDRKFRQASLAVMQPQAVKGVGAEPRLSA
jgi:ATP-dependent exoDNAse (exonuclease V) alpha subunit